MSGSRRALRGGLVLVTVALVGAWCISARPGGSPVAAWWPPVGISAALLLVSPRRDHPRLLVGIGVATGVACLLGGRPLVLAVLLGLGNALECATLLLLWRRCHVSRGRVETPSDYFALLRACVGGAAVMAAVAGASLWVTGGDGLGTALTVGPSHLASTVLLVPLVLIAPTLLPRSRRAEAVAQVAVFLAVAGLVFGARHLTLEPVVLLPSLVWAAMRLTPLIAAAEAAAVACVATVSTSLGRGPFGSRGAYPDVFDSHLSAATASQVFLLCAGLLAVPAALASYQRTQLLRRLDAQRTLSDMTLNTANALICVSDPRGVVLQVNETVRSMTGFAVEEVVGRDFWDCPFLPEERRGLVREMFASPDGLLMPPSREARVVTKSGDTLTVVWSNSVVRDADGSVTNMVCTATDVTSERTSTGLVRHLMDAPMKTLVVGVDRDRRVTLANHGAGEVLARSSDELVGTRFDEVLLPAERDAFAADLDPRRWAAEDDGPQPRDWTVVLDADDAVTTVFLTVSPTRDDDGHLTGFLLVGGDVAEQRQSQELLVRALDKERHVVDSLRRLDSAKDEFVSTVSHELRTPTTSIIGYTEMLLEGEAGEITPAQEAMLGVIARNGERLTRVAGDLLTLAKLEVDGELPAADEPVDLREVLASAEETVRPLHADRDLDVRFVYDGPAAWVRGDASHLERAVTNLVSNAVKFTPDPGRVFCTLVQGEGRAVVQVVDTGIGIPCHEVGAVFDKFFRSSTTQERQIQGAGLGLSIVQSIVQRHGGTVEVRSAPDRGSTFVVTFPLMAVSARSCPASA